MRVGIIGASGYSGGEVLRYLSTHPDFHPEYIAAGSNAGVEVTSLHPHLTHLKGRRFEETSIDRANEMDLLFLALPHGQSAGLAQGLREGVKVVDLGADYRLESALSWAQYYGGEHAGTWVYGLPELKGSRERIKGSQRIANPGCYATSIIIGAAPFVDAGVIDIEDITVVAASGTTGAGRTAKVNLLGSEVMGSLSSYKFGGIHQHTPEIEEALSRSAASKSVRISFTPILAPMPRGILTTITSRTKVKDLAELTQLFTDYYQGERFIHLLEDEMPRTSSVNGSNHVHVRIALDTHTSRWMASVAIDNLGKGAAGQALQNANLIAGLDEDLGLNVSGIGA